MKLKSRVFRHKKTGQLYRIVIDDAVMSGTSDRMVVYRSIHAGPHVVRLYGEFMNNFEEAE